MKDLGLMMVWRMEPYVINIHDQSPVVAFSYLITEELLLRSCSRSHASEGPMI